MSLSNQSNAAAKLLVPEPHEGGERPRFAGPGAWEIRPVSGEQQAIRPVSAEPHLSAQEERDVRLDELGHDLRVPLNAISMGIQLVQRDVATKAEILSSMLFTVKRINRLIDQFLRSARSGTNELVLKREGVSLAAICREAIEEASLAYPGHPIDF